METVSVRAIVSGRDWFICSECDLSSWFGNDRGRLNVSDDLGVYKVTVAITVTVTSSSLYDAMRDGQITVSDALLGGGLVSFGLGVTGVAS